MLEQLLAEIQAGGTLEVRALAARLNTTPALVEMMLEHLARSGKIASYRRCEGACGGCGLKDACGHPGDRSADLRLWQA